MLLHVSEFVVIGGVTLGVLVVASPKSILLSLISDIKESFFNSGVTKEEILDILMKARKKQFLLLSGTGKRQTSMNISSGS